MSYVKQWIEKQGGNIRLIQGMQQGESCWFYLKVDPFRFKDYQQAVKQPSTCVGDFGEVLESGWGDAPPAEVIQQMKAQYDFDTAL